MSYIAPSMADLPEQEQLVACPYNKNHMVVQHRMPKHLIKCRKSTSTAGTKKCRFNATHIVPAEEIDYHHKICPERTLVERFMDINQEGGEDKRPQPLRAPVAQPTDFGEDWDKLEEKTTSGVVEARERAKRSNVIFSIQHGTPSDRKRRRQEEADRLAKICNK